MRGRTEQSPDIPRDKRSDYWGVVLEAPDPHVLAHFYADLLGWEIASESAEGAALIPPGGVAYLAVQYAEDYVPPVWPAEEGKQRITMHLDFEVDDLAAALEHAVELGGRVPEFPPQDNVRVVLDPAGHPFCLYVGS